MSVDELGVVDFVSFEKSTDRPRLTATHHLDWSVDSLYLLQEKLNSYIWFIESGELAERFPEALGKQVIVTVVSRWPPNELATAFFSDVEKTLTSINVVFELRVFDPFVD